jgi:DNA-binding XRE family transcriptional regulator
MNNINVKEQNVVKQIRSRLDLTQEQFSQSLGISRRALCQYESGESEPRLTVKQFKELLIMASRAGFTLDDLESISN